MLNSISTIVIAIATGWIASTIVMNKILSKIKNDYPGEMK